MRIAHFVSGFPVLSETFVLDEIRAFAQEGFENVIVSLRPPPREIRSQEDEGRLLGGRTHEDLGLIEVLDPLLSPFAGIRAFVFSPKRTTQTKIAFILAALSAPRESLRMLWSFQRVLEAAPALSKLGISHCHAHFAHYPASAAWGCSRILGTTFSWNAHGYDLYRYRAQLETKVSDADLIFPVSSKNREFILAAGKDKPGLENRVSVSRCGIDLGDYRFETQRRPCSDAAGETVLVSVGRLVDIKGFSTLIDAVRLLTESGQKVRAEIIGEGPERKSLENRIAAYDLSDRVELLGPMSRGETREHQRRADIAVQPSHPGKHGPEGIPVVLMEAMALGVPVVSTRFASIPELLEDGVTGHLVDPDDPKNLAEVLAGVIEDPSGNEEMVSRARKRVEEQYDGPANFHAKARKIRELVG